jgi:hypothetical protein
MIHTAPTPFVNTTSSCYVCSQSVTAPMLMLCACAEAAFFTGAGVHRHAERGAPPRSASWSWKRSNMAAGQHCRCTAQPMLTPTWVPAKSALAILGAHSACPAAAWRHHVSSAVLRYLYAVAVQRLFTSRGGIADLHKGLQGMQGAGCQYTCWTVC